MFHHSSSTSALDGDDEHHNCEQQEQGQSTLASNNSAMDRTIDSNQTKQLQTDHDCQPVPVVDELNSDQLDVDCHNNNFEYHRPSSHSSEDSDEFCDFETYNFDSSKTVNVDHIEPHNFSEFTSSDGVKAFENFANFDSTISNSEETTNQNHSLENDDEFADFESASNFEIGPTQSQTYPLPSDEYSCSELCKIFSDTFQNASCEDELRVESSELNKPVQPTTKMLLIESSSASMMLWNSLQAIELKPISSLHKWHESHSFQCLLQALKLDKHIIRHDRMSIFGSHSMQILEPEVCINRQAPTRQLNQNEKFKPVELTPSDVPGFPSQSYLNQDLDFFEFKYSNQGSNQQAIKDDLISEFENIVEPVSKSLEEKSTSTAPVASDLREMLKSTISKSNKNEQVLSAEALQILTELPDLSFIRARVLMFPVHDQPS